MDVVDQIIGAESGGDPNAQNPNSSAGGLGQFTDGTWLDMINQYRPDLAQGKSQQDILALKSDPDLSRQMTGAYAAQNAKTLTNAGFSATPGNIYLAHFAGPQGAVNILNADPSASVSDVLGSGVIKANPFLKGMTVSGLQQWAAGKMGGGNATAVSAPNPSPTNIAPPSVPAGAVASAQPAAPAYGGMLGGGSNNALALAQQLGSGNGLLNNNPAPKLMQPMQLPNGTPAAALLRQQILASIGKGAA